MLVLIFLPANLCCVTQSSWIHCSDGVMAFDNTKRQCVCGSWASSLCFITVDEWQKKWWNTVPKSNGNLLKYTGRISTSEIRMFSIRHFLNFSKETRTVDLTLSTATTDPLWFSSTRSCLCSNVRVSLSVFVSAGLASCRAEVVHPSLTGLASAVYHARVGGLCTYPSWRVRTNL